MGINHLATIGHLEENYDYSLQKSWQRLVDINGSVSRGCYCAEDPEVMNYIRQSYIELAKAKPDFIWIDDDVRMESHPWHITLSCFCKFCLKKFSIESNMNWTRKKLQKSFSSGTIQQQIEIRRKWLEHCRNYISNILSNIRAAVDAINPKIQLGFMTAGADASGFGISNWAKILAGQKNINVKWRPGGGFYNDDVPRAMLDKIHSVGRQIELLPYNVKDIQYELENFPYQSLAKSTSVFKTELAVAEAVGCKGILLNILDITTCPALSESRPFLKATRQAQSFLDFIVSNFNIRNAQGIWPLNSRDRFAVLNLNGHWRNAQMWESSFSSYNKFSETGLPFTYHKENASVILMKGDDCLLFKPEELKEMLSKSVYIDGKTLQHLNEMGLGDLTGFTVKRILNENTIEVFARHSINGENTGLKRDCRPSFWHENTYVLEPSKAGTKAISFVTDFNDEIHGIACGVFENKLGGRVCVSGYYPWQMFLTEAKLYQLRNIFLWLSRDQLPAYVNSHHRMVIWAEENSNASATFILNTSLDTAQDVIIMIKGNTRKSVTVIFPGGQYEKLFVHSSNNKYEKIIIPAIPPFSPALILR